MHGLEDLAITPLLPLSRDAGLHYTSTAIFRNLIIATPDCCIDRRLEDLMYAVHFFGRAFHVHCSHLFGNSAALLLRDWC